MLCACATTLQRDCPPLHAASAPAAPNKSQGQTVRMREAAVAVPGAAVVLLLLKGPRTPAPPAPRASRGFRRLRHRTVPRAPHPGPAAPVRLTGTDRRRALGCEELLAGLSSSSTVGSEREAPVPLCQPGCGSSSTASAGSAGCWCPARPCPALRPRCCCAPVAAAQPGCGWQGTTTPPALFPRALSRPSRELYSYPTFICCSPGPWY